MIIVRIIDKENFKFQEEKNDERSKYGITTFFYRKN